MTQTESIEIWITYRNQDGVEAQEKAILCPGSEEPDYYDPPLPTPQEKSILAEGRKAMGPPEGEDELAIHLYWGGDERIEGFEDCNPLPDGSEVIVEETDGGWVIRE
jgi:hypothetical protein